MFSLLLMCCLFGLGSAWTQPSTCYVRQSTCSADSELTKIRETLYNFLTSYDESLRQSVELLTSIKLLLTGPPPIGSLENPASSCRAIPEDELSGYYWIQSSTGSPPVEVYCDMYRTSCGCNVPTGWARVAYLDLTNENHTCPEEFVLREFVGTSGTLRTCSRPDDYRGCISTMYQTHGITYSQVCGQIRGYQYESTDTFLRYHSNNSITIDSFYVDGISLTHGEPKQHIWTFAAGHREDQGGAEIDCPCSSDSPFRGTIPPFVGDDYFCETATPPNMIHPTPEEPLWDGQDCGPTSTCCEFNNPPWFCKQLLQPTTDDIELRICSDEFFFQEDIPFDLVEIYVR